MGGTPWDAAASKMAGVVLFELDNALIQSATIYLARGPSRVSCCSTQP
jgi:hypothetical protein